MRYSLAVIGMTLCGALMCACTPNLKPHAENTGDYVSADSGRLGWAGIFLNESRGDLENKLGKVVEVHDQAFPACGEFASQIVLDGRSVTLEWSQSSSDATIDSIEVDLPSAEYMIPAATIAEQINDRLPSMKMIIGDDDGAQLNYAKGEVILIKNGKENFLPISPEGCLD